jgi:hypothetical protein
MEVVLPLLFFYLMLNSVKLNYKRQIKKMDAVLQKWLRQVGRRALQL